MARLQSKDESESEEEEEEEEIKQVFKMNKDDTSSTLAEAKVEDTEPLSDLIADQNDESSSKESSNQEEEDSESDPREFSNQKSEFDDFDEDLIASERITPDKLTGSKENLAPHPALSSFPENKMRGRSFSSNVEDKTPIKDFTFIKKQITNTINILQSSDSPTESCRWLNRFIDVLYHHFIDEKSDEFESILCKILKGIYNKNRPSTITEIQLTKAVIGGSAPELLSFTLLEAQPHEVLVDVDLSFRGTVDIELTTDILVNFRSKNLATIPLLVKAHVKSLNGRLRIYFSKKENKGWYAYVTRPILKIELDPIIGEKNKIFLKNYTKIYSFIEGRLQQRLNKYTLPNKRPITIPFSGIQI